VKILHSGYFTRNIILKKERKNAMSNIYPPIFGLRITVAVGAGVKY